MEVPNFMKIFIGLIIIVFMVAIFWLTSWKTLQKDIDDIGYLDAKTNVATGKFKDIKEKLDKYNGDLTKKQELENEIAKLKRDIEVSIQQQLTSESEAEFVPSYMADVEKLVEHQRIRMNDPDFIITSMTPEKSGSNSSSVDVLASYPARSFQMQLTGRYTTIIDFLRQLGALKLKRLVTVSKLTLAGSPNNGKDDYFKSPMLTITMPISVYLRKEGN